MGFYDYVIINLNEFQIKSTPNPQYVAYREGAEIPLDDGLHLTYEGWFIVKNGKVFDGGTKVFDKWGNEIDLYKMLEETNPLTPALKEIFNGVFKEKK